MIVVLGDRSGATLSLARGLRRLGEPVVLGALDPAVPPGDDVMPDDVLTDDVMTLRCAMTSQEEVAGVLARAEDAGGPLDAVVLVSVGTAAAAKGDLAGLDPAQWRERVESPLQRTLACFQGSYRRLRARGGSFVILVPTLSLVGSAGFAPWAAVAEAQRALAKSAARVWGHERITMNCVAVPGALLAAPAGGDDVVGGRRGGDGTGPDRPGLPPPSLVVSPDMEHGVAPVVASLVAAPWTEVSGATVAVDGGIWMTP